MPRIPVSSFYTSMLPPLNPCWEEVLHLTRRYDYPRGSRLTLNTERENYFYFLARGHISILQDMENGKTRTISTLEAGTLLNVTHALVRQATDFIERGCHFFCLTDVTLCRFDADLLQNEDFLRRYPHLIANLMVSFSVKILALHSILSNFGTGGALATVCRFFLNLADAHDGATDFAPRISQTELAKLLGMNRATLVRLLRELRRRGIILEMKKNRLIIGDIDALRRIVLR